jgi:dCTP diphosphatase
MAQHESFPGGLSAPSLEDLQKRLREFAEEREWPPFHTPRNLAALISTEAGELLTLFRWGQDSLSERRIEVEDELADVILGVLRFADVAQIDIIAAAYAKLRKNAVNYPVEHRGPDRST